MINIRTRLMLLMLLALSKSILAQDYTEQIAIPNAPTAAALGKYGDIPVSLHSGVPQISIPIFEATGSRLSVPISLSYHAGGIKVEEIASWVGLGWSLNSGGVINRQVNGIPDHHSNGWFNNGSWIENLAPPTNPLDPNYNIDNAKCVDIESGVYDPQPDVFSFNFPGGAGQFVFDHDETTYSIIPHKKYKIELVRAVGTFADILEIIITTDDGTKYYFSDPVKTSSIPSCRSKNTIWDAYQYNSSWYLTKIEAANGLDEITFNYSAPYYIVTDHVTRQTHIEDLWYRTNSSPVDCIGDIKYQTVRLTSIHTSKYKINFIANTNREDLPHPSSPSLPADKRLDEIEITDVDDNLIKTFNLNYGYFTNSTNDVYNKRLKLESVQEEGRLGATKPPHVFTYNNSVTLPSLKSKSQDLWGFYNGKTNSTLIPELNLHIKQFINLPAYGMTDDVDRNYPGADRSVDVSKTKFAILEKITYPTGGHTTFTYEGNEHNTGAAYKRTSALLSGYHFNFVTEPDSYTELLNPVNHQAQAIKPLGIQDASTTFTVPFEQLVNVDVSFSAGNLSIYGGSQNAKLYKYNTSTSTYQLVTTKFQSIEGASADFQTTLEAGDYKITAHASVPIIEPGKATIKVTIYQSSQVVNVENKIGGLRIKEIKSYTSSSDINPKIRAYKYTETNTSTESSGIQRKRERYFSVTAGASIFVINISSHPSSGRQYSPIYYKHVIELEGANGENGRTEHDFIDLLSLEQTSEFPAQEADFYPFPKATSYSWAEGLNLNTTVYNSTGAKVQETVNTYSHHLLDEIQGYSFASTPAFVGNLLGIQAAHHNKYTSSYKSGYSLLTKSESYTYDLLTPANSVKTTTDYSYDNFSHLNKTKETVTNSKAENQVTKYLYAQDVTGVAGTATLITDNIISIPLEVQQWIDAGTTKRLTSASKTAFNGDILPEEVWQAELSDPLSFTSASPPDLSSYYERRAIYDFDNTEGILLEFEKEDGTSTAFIWGYDKIYPVAKVDNATQQDLINVLGSGLNNGTAGLTAAQITSLKTALPQSLITTFVYDKRYGLTSITDPNGLKIEYFYDEFGRLSHTKDQDGNILSRQDYNYNINNQSGQ